MVIGNGLLAKAFGKFSTADRIIIFASGVSNSGETNPVEFQREIQLLKQSLSASLQLIYFSTISIYDNSLRSSPYILHKLSVEELIKARGTDYLIFRLPILVGKTNNPNTLTNFLFSKIKAGEPVNLFTKACRYLMDAEDVSLLLTKMIESNNFHKETLDINFNNALYAGEIIRIYERVLQKKAIIERVEKGSCYPTDNKKFLDFMESTGFKVPENYEDGIIRKYYGEQK